MKIKMSAKRSVVCCFVISVIAMVNSTKVKVAVYEHVVISPDNPEAYFTRQEAFQWMSKNLEVFDEQSQKAAKEVFMSFIFRAL
jgi:hypothetical protein